MSCTIIDSKFIEDLSPYTLDEADGALSLNFGGQVSLVDFNISKLQELYDDNIAFDGVYESNTWRPIYVRPHNSEIITKKINRNFTSALDNKLGIESFMSFKPIFNNWFTEANMSLDWFITDDNFAFFPLYGILGWAKTIDLSNITIQTAAPDTVFKTTEAIKATTTSGEKAEINGGVSLIKYTDDVAINLSSLNVNNKYIRISSISNNSVVPDYGSVMSYEGQPLQLYISDGDFFSYHENTSAGRRNYQEFNQLSSSHISATIWKDYQYVYNIISKVIENNVDYTDVGPDLDNRRSNHFHAIKKLSSVIATHPLRDGVTQDLLLLPEITSSIVNFVTDGARNVENEINQLDSAIASIFNNKYFTDILGDYSQSNYKGGFINSKSDLFNKMISKYESYLNIQGINSVNCTRILPAGPHVYVNSILTNHCKKDIKDAVLYNNTTFRIGGYTFATDFNEKESEYEIITPDKTYKIPLFDSGKDFEIYHIDKNIGVSAGPDIYIPMVAPGGGSCGTPEELSGFSFDPDLARLTSPPEKVSYTVDIKDIEKSIGSTLFRFYDIGSATFQWDVVGAIGGGDKSLEIKDQNTATPTFSCSTVGAFVVELTVTLDSVIVKDQINVYVVNETGCYIGVDDNGNLRMKQKVLVNKDPNQVGFDGVGPQEERIEDLATAAIPPGGYYSPTQQVFIGFNRNRQGELDPFLDFRFADAVILPNDRNIAKVPNIIELLFSKYGAVLPLTTNSYISVVSRAVIPNDDGQRVDASSYVARLDNARRSNKFYYDPIKNVSDDDSAKFSVTYNLTSQTSIKLYRIRLEKLRDNSSAERCKSIYRNLSYQTKTLQLTSLNQGFVTKYDRDLPGFGETFNRYEFNAAERIGKQKNTQELHEMPELSDYGVVIQPFGGRENPFSIDVPGITILDLTLPKTKPDIVYGHHLRYLNRICYLREAEIYSSTDASTDYGADNPNIKFTKGTFHPDYGFLTNLNEDHASYNKTSSLKFNPGNRTTFTLKGGGFYNTLKAGVATSTVTLDGPQFEAQFLPDETILDTSDPESIDIHHGYRLLEASRPTSVPKNFLLYDEFTGSYGTYRMGVRGRKLFIDLDDDEKRRLYGSNLLFPKIRNMEVKLNFLNQVNLKNVKIWLQFNACAKIEQDLEPQGDGLGIVDDIEDALDGVDDDGTVTGEKRKKFKADPLFNLLAKRDTYPIISNIPFENQGYTNEDRLVKNISSYIEHTEIAKYLQSIQENNVATYSNFVLYLLNGESVDSNTLDTTLHFSDRFSKNLTPRNSNTDYALNIDQKVNTTNEIRLQPSIANPSYTNHDEFIAAIKKNNLFEPNNSFSKFYHLPLFDGILDLSKGDGAKALPDSQTSVTLNIEVINTEDMVNLDVVSNLASKTSTLPTEKKQSADSVFNSLCSWDLIFHFDTDDFLPTDNLGHIKYGWAPHIPGYNFISEDANVADKLPASVLDAPNQKINDLSPCFYDEETDNTITPLRRPEDQRFPSEAIALALSSLLFGAVGGLIGLSIGFGMFLAALSAVTRFLSGIRRAEVAEQLDRAFVRSSYDKKGYGGSDKILLTVGTNGPIVYDIEVPIYKYSNTPLLKRKVRKYIKTSQIPELAEFNVLLDVEDMESLVTPYEFNDTSILSDNDNSGLKINKEDTVKSNTLVKLEDQLYVSSTGEWQKLDSTNIPLHVLSENNILGLDLSKLTNASIIQGTRAYNHFNIGNSVVSEAGNLKISNKGTILKNDIEYTVLQFESGRPPTNSKISIKPEENNNIIVWTDKQSDHYNSTIPATQTNSTLFPKGAYGNATPVTDSQSLSNQLTQNDVPTIYDIYNNQECNVKPNNRYEIYGADTDFSVAAAPRVADPNFAYNLGTEDVFPDESYPKNVLQQASGPNHKISAGYSYNLYNILDPKDRKGSDFIHVKNPEDDSSITFQHLLNNVHNVGSDNYNLVELSNPEFNEDIQNSGYIVVEGDYELGYAYGLSAIDINSLGPQNDGAKTDNESLNYILARLKYLDSTIFSGEEAFDRMTIAELTNKTRTLPDDDTACFTSSGYANANNTGKCKKLNAELALSNLLSEKNNLLNVLDTVGVIYNSKYQILYNPLIDDVKKHKTFSFSYTSERTPISFNQYDSDAYWINIDPYQECRVSASSSIKILVEARYVCFPTSAVVAGELGVIPQLDDDAQNICPSQTASFNTNDLQFESAGNVFTYKFQQNEISRQKEKYEKKYGIKSNEWSEVTFPGPALAGGGGTATRSFFIRPDRNSTDMLVEVTEKYLVPAENYFRRTIGLEEFPVGSTELDPDFAAQWDEDDPSLDETLRPEEFARKQELQRNRPYTGSWVGGLTGKVIDIMPDDVLNGENMVCRPQVIPRKLRKLDPHYHAYRSDFNGNLTPSLPRIGPGGPFTNILGLWHCIDTGNRRHADIPDYFKIKNEMIYRSYFGSKDNIEHVDELNDSKDPFEWIPYEYHPTYIELPKRD